MQVKEAQAAEQYKQIQKFIEGTVAEGAPVIPISAQLKYNIDVIVEYICKKIPSTPSCFLENIGSQYLRVSSKG